MNRMAQEALLAGLARRLYENGSWSGETHVQKAAYILHELGNVPFAFDFILYKHGPYSFELSDELTAMRAERLIERQPQPAPYGPRIVVTEQGRQLESKCAAKLETYTAKLDWVAARVASKNVLELEGLATALWITRHEPGNPEARATKLTAIKPHLDREAALTFVRETDALLKESSVLAM